MRYTQVAVTFGAPAARAGVYTPCSDVPRQVVGKGDMFRLPQLAGY